jgi:hypothetical protein
MLKGIDDMTITFDHAIIFVDNLERAMTDFRSLGFSVLPGGEHTEMGTHNALIIFQDATYIELLAAVSGRTPQGFPGRIGAEGFAGFCLRSDSLENDARAIAQRGMPVTPLKEGGRTRTDGQRVEWRIAAIEDLPAPFFIEDITDKRLRIPDEVATQNHKNEVIGTDSMTVLVDDVSVAVLGYADLLGELPQMMDESAVFDIEGFIITVRSPADDQERSYLEERPAMPYELVLRTLDHKQVGMMNISQSHQARIHLSGQANLRHTRYNPGGGVELE